VLDYGELAQDLSQVLKTKLSGSTGRVGQLGQPDLAALHGCLPRALGLSQRFPGFRRGWIISSGPIRQDYDDV